jgi:hypothetical protein
MFVLAYIDPGTGSIILQAIIGAIFAGLVTLKFYWARVKRVFTKRSVTTEGDNESRP